MEIKNAILKTICYFDTRDYPLKIEEIHSYLWGVKTSIEETKKTLFEMIGKGLTESEGFYFLKNREEIVKTRKTREKISDEKLKDTKSILNLLRTVPFLRGVAIIQSLAFNNCKEGSDIDIFIITSPGKIWIVRAMVNILLDIFRRRGKVKNAICPSFYLTYDKLSVENISLKPQDPDFVYIFNNFKPVFGEKHFTKFLEENLWLNNCLPNSKNNLKDSSSLNPIYWVIKKTFEVLLLPFSKIINTKLKNKQIKIINKNVKAYAKNPSIITNDFIIKTHYNDKRIFYSKEWQKKCLRFNS